MPTEESVFEEEYPRLETNTCLMEEMNGITALVNDHYFKLK